MIFFKIKTIIKIMKTLLLFLLALPVIVQGKLVANLSEKEVVALTIYGEARGEGERGMQAVASVIYNRSKNSDYRTVCLKRYQFSYWNDKLWVSIPKDKHYKYCLTLAEKMIQKQFKPVHKYQFYYAHKLCKPSWSKKLVMVSIIGNHTFGNFKRV